MAETSGRSWGRRVGIALLVLLVVAVAWWVGVRVTAEARRLAVFRMADVRPAPTTTATGRAEPQGATASLGAADPVVDPARAADPRPDTARADTIRVLAWNIAHNRGDLRQGPLQNFLGGSDEVRVARLARIAAVIREADADVVVLNEADFDAAWSGGLNHAETLARALGYPIRVEQRNFDYGTLSFDFAFGNALLTRLPVDTARLVGIPPHSRVEAALIGAKTAAVVVLETGAGPVGVVPIHLEFRTEATRLTAVAPLRALRDDAPPLVLAGDFNTGPPGWPGADSVTAVGRLMEAGWSSPRVASAFGVAGPTFPSPEPRRSIDWVLAEPPLRVLDSRVLTGVAELSDHLPVLAVVEVRARARTE